MQPTVKLLPPAVRVHGLAQARAALAPSLPVTLVSAPGAAGYAGCAWWRAVVRESGTPWPDALDCADLPGRALEALRCGQMLLVLHADAPGRARVESAAAALGATLLAASPPALDLGRPGAGRHLREWLAPDGAMG